MKGMEMMINAMVKAMGVDPKVLEGVASGVMNDVAAVKAEMLRQGALLDKIARKLEVNPDAESIQIEGSADHGE